MTYASPAWAFITKTQFSCLQVIQNRALIVICDTSRSGQVLSNRKRNKIIQWITSLPLSLPLSLILSPSLSLSRQDSEPAILRFDSLVRGSNITNAR